jgi:hypothetical protein
MDLNEITTASGMRAFTSDQRDTLINDARELRQIALIIKNRLATTQIDGDKPGSANRRAKKVDKKFQQAITLLEKAAGVFEAIEGTHRREVIELPARRAAALAKKEQRDQRRALTREKAHALTAQTLTESAHHLAADPRTGYPQPPAAAPQVVYNTPHPHAYTSATAGSDPLGDFAHVFNMGETG